MRALIECKKLDSGVNYTFYLWGYPGLFIQGIFNNTIIGANGIGISTGELDHLRFEGDKIYACINIDDDNIIDIKDIILLKIKCRVIKPFAVLKYGYGSAYSRRLYTEKYNKAQACRVKRIHILE